MATVTQVNAAMLDAQSKYARECADWIVLCTSVAHKPTLGERERTLIEEGHRQGFHDALRWIAEHK